jgi:2',3'-cyclic-nucleotide 2'-phosphodiesterase (5'-nucleotidase family)
MKEKKTTFRKLNSVSFFLGITILLISFFMLQQVSGQNKRFTLLHTSDEHSVLTPLPSVDYSSAEANPSLGGMARLAGLVNQIKRDKGEEPVLLLSAGDFVGGSPFSWLILEGYSPEIELMREIGYAATTIGNHEFDYGPEKLADYFKRAGYPENHKQLPVFAPNLNIPDGHVLNDIEFPSSRIFELDNGLAVGVFGLLGNEAYSLAPLAEPVTIFDPVETAQKQVDDLREKGADVVVLLSHSGVTEDRILAEKVNNIDVILGGHDHHQTLIPEELHNTIILHSANYFKYLGMLELEYDIALGKVKMLNQINNTPFQILLDFNVKEDSIIASKIEGYTQKLNAFVSEFTDSAFSNVFDPVMHTDFPVTMHAPLVETTVGNFVTDAMRLETAKVTGEKVDFAIQANGVIRGDILPGTMPWSEGKVSFLDLVTIAGLGSGPSMTAGYPIVSIYLTAEEVHNVFEIAGLLAVMMGDTYFLQVSGVRYSYDPGKAVWLKVPVVDLPVPAYKSLNEVYLYEGEGIQTDDDYVLLDKNSERLYHLVADHYLTSFLPMIGEILPRLKIVLKDKNGNPLEVDETIVYDNGREFKVWEAVARHATSFKPGSSGLPEMPAVYKATQGRINKNRGIPLYVWSYSGLFFFLAGIGLGIKGLIKRFRKKV